LNEGISSKRSVPPTQDKLTCTNIFVPQKRHYESFRDLLLDQRAHDWRSLIQPDHTNVP
jgi:hypothetical protein